MRLTQFTDYTLRVLMYLAADPDHRVTIQDIAQAYGISRNHLMKVVNHLARTGVVEASRGKGGGLRLARPPSRIGVGEVIRAAEGEAPIVECFADPRACRLTPACRLAGVLHEAFAGLYRELDRTTLADLVSPAEPVRKLLRMAG
ncbi:MAG: Rrf2 family transcriptional regulator [Chromatiales bacterium]|jgi:Rrf2 family nitric oxide-sensitive transcriptional repressor|nr:Rrf2 family transcriptional regulator [Chromatiales bacterium]